MLFSTVLAWLLVAAAFVVSLPALWLFAQGFWPQRVVRLKALAERGLLKSFLAGLLPLVVTLVGVTLLSKIPKAGAFSALVAGLLITWGVLGAAGLAAVIGERLWPQAEAWRQMKHGGVTVICCALLPVVGWLVLLPVLVVLGWGLQVRAWFAKAPESTALPATPTAAGQLPIA